MFTSIVFHFLPKTNINMLNKKIHEFNKPHILAESISIPFKIPNTSTASIKQLDTLIPELEMKILHNDDTSQHKIQSS